MPNKTVVTTAGATYQVEGGTRLGQNIFHSFEQFSLPTDTAVQFSAPGTEHILGRITGESVSDIDGTISVDGSANFFLLNPNGIVFGPHAELDIGGSFLASTANHLDFADGTTFSAVEPHPTPLLTVSAPVGLSFAGNPGDINVVGNGHNLTRSMPVSGIIERQPASTGLRVSSQQTLALIGGDVTLVGGNLGTETGRIELGSVERGEVIWSNPVAGEWTFSFDRVTHFRDLVARNRASIDVSGLTGGSIGLTARQVDFTGGAVAVSQTTGSSPGGMLTVKASDALSIDGTAPDLSIRSGLFTETLGAGRGGDIRITAPALNIDNAGAIYTTTFSAGKGGGLAVNAIEAIEVSGFSPRDPEFFSLLSAAAYGNGRAGNVQLNTGTLRLDTGSAISSISIGQGHGGRLAVRASDGVEVIGGVERTPFRPSILATTTLSSGNAGQLSVDTGRVTVTDGGRIDSSTFAMGNAGSISVNASESVEVTGRGPGGLAPSAILSSAPRLDPLLQQSLGLPALPAGSAGNLTVSAPHIAISDGASINVSTVGSGDAGTLKLATDSLVLDRAGEITASTQTGNGGNVFLDIEAMLQLRRGSQISASAKQNGTGGNINISTEFVLAVPLENSDISTDAVKGNGGNISLSTSGIFGIEPRRSLTPLSDINASSEFGVDGTIDVLSLELDPSGSLVELPSTLIDTTQTLTRECSRKTNEYTSRENYLAIVGRGGLPTTPGEPSATHSLMTPWVSKVEQTWSQTEVDNNNDSLSAGVEEARGWRVKPNGQIVLTAQTSANNSHSHFRSSCS